MYTKLPDGQASYWFWKCRRSASLAATPVTISTWLVHYHLNGTNIWTLSILNDIYSKTIIYRLLFTYTLKWAIVQQNTKLILMKIDDSLSFFMKWNQWQKIVIIIDFSTSNCNEERMSSFFYTNLREDQRFILIVFFYIVKFWY